MSLSALVRTAITVSCLFLIFAWTGSAAAVEEAAAEEPVEYVDDEVTEDDEEAVESVDDEVTEDEGADAEEDDDTTTGEDAADDPDEGVVEIDSYGEVEIDPGALSPIERAQRSDVEDLYVTATKRQESVQDVPISMTALSSSFLDDSGITAFGQIGEYVPNMTINPVTDTRGTVIKIRGIGSPGTNAGIDPSVGVFIDGVYQGRAGMSTSDLLDIERVEVLRGPQGTLYGKNTAAGLINIISKRPNYEWEAVSEGVFGNYGNYEGRASVNVPIIDEHVAARLSAYRVTREGFDKRLNIGGREYEPGSGKPTPPPNDAFVFQDGRVNDANKWGTKARLLWDATDSLSFLVTGDYSYENTVCCVADIITFEGVPTLGSFFDDSQPPGQKWVPLLTFQNLAMDEVPGPNGKILPGTGIPLPRDDRFDHVVMANDDPSNKVKIGGVAIDGTYEIPEMPVLGGSAVNLIASWRTYATDSAFDGDFSYYDVARWATDVHLNQYSAELRLTSPGGELVDYQTGFYFYHQDMDTIDELRFKWDALNLFELLTPTANVGNNTHKTWSYAGFGQVTLNPIEQVSITGGVRVTHEKKTRVGTQTCERLVFKFPQDEWIWEVNTFLDIPPICGPPVTVGPGENERSVTNVSGMATVRYFPTEDAMLYGSFATGFKSGGFNQLRVSVGTPSVFDDEESMNIEGGFKTTWFDRMLTFNLTGFYTEYDQFQAQIFDGTSVSVRNAGSLESYGAEGEIVLAPLPGLVFGSSIGFNIAQYTDFENGEQTAQQRWDATGGQILTGCAPPAPVELCVQDLKGKRLDNAPDWTVSSFAQFEYPLPWYELEFFTRAEYSFMSTRYLAQDLDPNLKQNSTHIVNLRVGLRGRQSWGEWELTSWVRNLSDEKWNVVGFDVPTLNGFAGINAPPRQYGLTVRLDFTDFSGLPGLFGF